MPPSDYDKTKTADVSTASGNPTVSKAQPVLVSDGDDSTTGTGDAIIDFAGVSDAQDIAVYDTNDNLLNYEIESLDTTSGTGVLWVYNSWVRDGTTQIKLAYGSNSANTDRQNPTATYTSEYDNVQHFNDDPLTATDSTNNNIDGNINGATSSTNSQFAKTASFDGIDDTIDFPNYTTPTGANNALTISGWFYIDSDNSDTDIQTFWRWGSGGIQIYQPSDDALTFNSSGIDPSEFGSIPIQEWLHIVVVLENTGSGTNIEIFVDGASVGTATKNLSFDYTHLKIAGNFGGRNLGGDVDEFKVFNTGLSQSSVEAEYDASPKAGQTFFNWNAAQNTSSGQTFSKTTTESATVSDDTLITAGLSVDESVSTSDSTTSTASFTRSFTNTVDASDTFTASRVLTALANETASVSDSSSVTVSYTRDQFPQLILLMQNY